MWQGWINGILGLWLIASAFIVTGSNTGNLANNVAVGVIFLVLGLWAAVRRSNWQSWLISLVGVWMIIAGLWFPSSYNANVTNDIVAGVVTAVTGFWAGLIPARKEAHA